MIQGIDVSHWQDAHGTPQTIDFARAKSAGAEFVFVKASQACWADHTFVTNWANAKAAGLLRGAYHYLDWTKPAREQAAFFCGLIEPHPGELPPVVDYECTLNAPEPADAAQALREFCAVVASAIKTPIIYTSPGYWAQYGSASGEWAGFPLWVAHYTYGGALPIVPKPWAAWTFWQYTRQGYGPKYGMESAMVDLDYFNGDMDALRQFAGLEPPALTLEQKVEALWAAHPELWK